MLPNHSKLFIMSVTFLLVSWILASVGMAFASSENGLTQRNGIAHPITPGTPSPTAPSRYSVPFNRNENTIVTNGPGEGGPAPTPGHYGKSAEAIDFSPKNYGWTQVLAIKPGHVYINDLYPLWGNLVVIKSDVAPFEDAFYAYYAHLADPAPTFAIGQEVADRQYIGTVGETGCANPCVHIHSELRDLMSNNAPGSGNSTNHPIRRLRGIGWYPWYPDAAMNSGFVPKSTSHPIGGCYSNPIIIVRWPASWEFEHVDSNGLVVNDKSFEG